MGVCAGKRSTNAKHIKSNSINSVNSMSQFKPIVTEIKQEITELYQMKTVLGKGRFGIVRKAVHKANNNLRVAIKTISKSDKIFNYNALQHEINILRIIDHPNIVKFYDFYEDSTDIHIVMEYCSGGELFDRIISNGSICEKEAAKYLYKILGAVNYLHLLGVCHRDLKPQNFLFENKTEDAELKIIDFGLSNNLIGKVQGFDRMSTFVGTPYYIAPEILQGTYDIKCDLWSLGVTMFVMLTGEFPFNGGTPGQIYSKIAHKSVEMEVKYLEGLSDNAQDLIKKLLVKNPQFRIDAKEALKHPWFFEAPSKELKGQNNVIQLLRNYTPPNKAHKAAVGILVKYLAVEELKELRNVFFSFDYEKNGFLTQEVIEKVISDAGVEISKKQMNKIFKHLSQKDGKICYSEFLTTMISEFRTFDENQVLGAFKMLDSENSGFITVQCLYDAYEQTGKSLVNFKIVKNSNGLISFEEFKRIVCGH